MHDNSPSLAPRVLTQLCALSLMLAFSGCAITTPDLRLPINGGDFEEGLSQGRLIGYIKCSIGQALRDVMSANAADRLKYGKLAPMNPAPWLADWGAQVSLKVAIDENSNISPGATFKTPMRSALTKFSTGDVTTARSFGLPITATATSQATRTETIQFYFYFPDLAESYGGREVRCKPHGDFFINGDLKIDEFIVSKVRVAQVPGLLQPRPDHPADNAPLDAFTYQVSFVVVTSGGINPTWSLARVVINPGSGSLIGASRKRTDDLLITIGPTDHSKKGAPTDRASQAHFSALFGQAIR
ncbi:hypothetical protein [Sphingomonas sp. Leaf4]|uniref:hypothetical protein n=1 Tax=Sphingomonas sp. Leaf4 TaxID=2876553 RepID=UPI001E3CA672|nr:hypothetical protein [Sphingomonas sp. Leaf4]